MKLYIFNPDADLALADGGDNYIAPAAARLMAGDLALLPVWYAGEGDGVWAPSAYNDSFLKRMRDSFALDARLVTYPELPDYADADVVPWGWNLSLRRKLMQGGFPSGRLPSVEDLCFYRQCASREHVAGCLEAFRGIPSCRGESVALRDLPACREYVEGRGHVLLKAPWSGSGKGLCWCTGTFTSSVAGWCAKVLRGQGCVVASPVYDKVVDFAMEFDKDKEGRVSFIGYSLFHTNDRGAYGGNLLLSDAQIEEYLTRYVPLETLHRVREVAKDVLERRFVGYAGCLGIDMMVCRSGEGFWIHPCVEVNLRMNMGIVAGSLYRRLLAPDAVGYFRIEYHTSPDTLRAYHFKDETAYPLTWHEGRIMSGYMPLVPVTPSSCYRAYIKVFPDTGYFRCHNGQWP